MNPFDPFANILEQVELARLLVEDPEHAENAARLAELVLALVEWRAKGGVDPFAAEVAPCGR